MLVLVKQIFTFRFLYTKYLQSRFWLYSFFEAFKGH